MSICRIVRGRRIYETGEFPADRLVSRSAKAAPIKPPVSLVISSGKIRLRSTATVKPRCEASAEVPQTRKAAFITFVFYRQFLKKDYVSEPKPLRADDGDAVALKPSKPGVIITIAREHGSSGKQIGKLVAQKLGIPTVIHEQNAYPGVTTKMLAKHADCVMLAVEDAKKYLERTDNCVFTGNPVRTSVLKAERAASRKALGLDERPLVLSFGGSLGAAAINRAAAYMLGESAKEKKYQHIHGYGQHDEKFLDEVHAAGVREEENPQIRMLEYIHNMPECLAAADLVIGRAGAITLTEIEATGKCSILIPSPNVAENHQFHNAMALVNRDAAVLIEEKDLTGEKLWETVNEILSKPGRAEEIGRNARAMAVLDANERIYRIIKAKAK